MVGKLFEAIVVATSKDHISKIIAETGVFISSNENKAKEHVLLKANIADLIHSAQSEDGTETEVIVRPFCG